MEASRDELGRDLANKILEFLPRDTHTHARLLPTYAVDFFQGVPSSDSRGRERGCVCLSVLSSSLLRFESPLPGQVGNDW